ncbi:hypothetical protein P4234_16430 [Pseudomonas aeruginosa]|nr:hypothetical protein [Pseudomonas aeruginosa]
MPHERLVQRAAPAPPALGRRPGGESLLDPANDYLRIVRAPARAWTCGNGSPPPAQGCATACCGMAASCFVASR